MTGGDSVDAIEALDDDDDDDGDDNGDSDGGSGGGGSDAAAAAVGEVWRDSGAPDYGVGYGVGVGEKVEMRAGYGSTDPSLTDSLRGLEAVPLQRVSSHQPRPVAASPLTPSSGTTITHTGAGSRIMPKSMSMNGMADLKVRSIPLTPL